MFIVFLLFFFVVFFSALCSMTEAALLSLSFVRARVLYENKKASSKELLFLKQNISDTVALVVVFNNAVNIVGSIFIGQQVTIRFGDKWLGLVSTLLTIAIIIFSEIIPKTIGERYRVRISLFVARPLYYILKLTRPIVALLMNLTKPFVQTSRSPRVTEDEIRMMLRVARDEGTVEMDEEVLCNRVFKLNDVRAVQIMKPIDQIYALPANKSLSDLKDEIIGCRFSRIALYDKDPLDIVGTVQQRVLLREIAKDNFDSLVQDFMRKPIFVNWFTKADDLLEKFQLHNQHLFIVQDNEGKDVGLVTMEDVLEELFGEIYDEKDRPTKDENEN